MKTRGIKIASRVTLEYSSFAVVGQPNLRCVAIFGIDGFDLTPSGTSTCAHVAAKRAKGEMSVGDTFVMESVTGAVIQGVVIADTRLGDVDAIIPEISGQATVLRREGSGTAHLVR
jgi:proline racemase